MKRSYSVQAYRTHHGYEAINPFLNEHRQKFERTFGVAVSASTEIELIVKNNEAMIDVYQELRFNPKFSKLYTVKHHPTQELTLLISGQKTLFDYLGSKEPNLLTLSRLLEIDFEVVYVQNYSNTSFKGEVVQGELLGRQCLVAVNNIVPELSLGLLNQIGSDEVELELLLTRIIPFQTETIL